MSELYQIEKMCIGGGVNTITLDIFDTVLIRKIHPEEKQFLIVAEKWLPLFKEYIDESISVEKLVYWRLYIRRELFDVHEKYNAEKTFLNRKTYDLNLKLWFENLLIALSNSFNISLAPKKKDEIVNEMIKAELATEIENLSPNTTLINCIRKIKKQYPKLKVYFVSDMYLTTSEIEKLLEAKNISDVFDGGISSTDAGYVKWNASLYYHLADPKIFGDNFNIFKNLHIGDNEKSDYLMPLRAGSMAIQLKKNAKYVRIESRKGGKFIKSQFKKDKKEQLRKLKKALILPKSDKTDKCIWIKYGELLIQPLVVFLQHVSTAALNSPDTTFLLVSSEAKMFKELADNNLADTLNSKNIVIADKLNRRMMLRAVIYQLMNDKKLQYNLHSIIEHVYYGETDRSRIETYKFIFGEDYPVSELTLNLRNDSEFIKSLQHDLISSGLSEKSELKNAYEYVISIVKKLNRRTIIVDVGWGGTVQVLLTEFVNNLSGKYKIDGLYLGSYPADRFAIKNPPLNGYLLKNCRDGEDRAISNPVLWEFAYTNKAQFDADASRLKLIREGFNRGIKLYREYKLSPYDSYTETIMPSIKRLMQNPSRREARALGSIEFDIGFIEKNSFIIVDTSYSQARFYAMLLRHPRGTIRNIIYRQNCWPAGYISYYRLYGLKAALKVYGRLRRKHYI